MCVLFCVVVKGGMIYSGSFFSNLQTVDWFGKKKFLSLSNFMVFGFVQHFFIDLLVHHSSKNLRTGKFPVSCKLPVFMAFVVDSVTLSVLLHKFGA